MEIVNLIQVWLYRSYTKLRGRGVGTHFWISALCDVTKGSGSISRLWPTPHCLHMRPPCDLAPSFSPSKHVSGTKHQRAESCTRVLNGLLMHFAICVFIPGSVYSWGMGTNMQLGTGLEDDEWTPVKITGKQLENRSVLMASSGGQHTVLLVKDNQESWFWYEQGWRWGGVLYKVCPCTSVENLGMWLNCAPCCWAKPRLAGLVWGARLRCSAQAISRSWQRREYFWNVFLIARFEPIRVSH